MKKFSLLVEQSGYTLKSLQTDKRRGGEFLSNDFIAIVRSIKYTHNSPLHTILSKMLSLRDEIAP